MKRAWAERWLSPERLAPCRGRALFPLGGSDAMKLLGDLCPEAARRLYGDGGMTPIELFCEERPAPAAVRL